MRPAIAPFLAAFVLATLASADAQAANAPTLDSIPEARVPTMLHPKDSPDQVDATERIEGVTASFAKVRQFGSVTAVDGRCVTIGAIPPGAVPSGNSSAGIRVAPGTMPLRVERFVGADAGKPELEFIDGWVDMNSTGMRAEKTSRIPLTVIGKGPAGYQVYGFRSEGMLHAVFPTPSRFVTVDSSGKLGFGGCGHARLVLDPASPSGSLVLVAGLMAPPVKAPKLKEDDAPVAIIPSPSSRGIEASVSISRTKRDKKPLLSVTVGWAEDEPPASAVANGAMAEPVRAPEAEAAHFEF